jgi:hypothetical protein
VGAWCGRWIVAVCILCAGAEARADWWHANFHAHAATDLVGDDGSEPPRGLHAALLARGFHFSAHTPHSTLAKGAAPWWKQRASEDALGLPLTVTVGQELTVAPGPAFRQRNVVLGHEAPGNLNHLSLIGSNRFVPTETKVADACRATHAGGGICVVNHPGPGPLMWEEGLWEAPANRGLIDAIEVYNGQARATAGIDFEARYREATAYRGLALKVAAVTGADTHGPASVERARRSLASFGKIAQFLQKMAPPASAEGRPELDAVTLVEAASPSLADVLAAVRGRRSVAVYGLPGLALRIEGLGEVRRTRRVKLALDLGRKVAEIVLYREGEAIKTWADASAAQFEETIERPSAYVFAARDGFGRLMTSAIWYEPPTM